MSAKTSRTSRNAVRSELDLIPVDFLWCRDKRHSWKPYTARWEGKRRLVETVVCANCDATKSRTLSDKGAIVKKWSTPKYPDGYIQRGLGRLTPEENNEVRIRSTLHGVTGALHTHK